MRDHKGDYCVGCPEYFKKHWLYRGLGRHTSFCKIYAGAVPRDVFTPKQNGDWVWRRRQILSEKSCTRDDLNDKPPATKADKEDRDSVRDASESFSSAPRKRKFKERAVDSSLEAHERSDYDNDRSIIACQELVILEKKKGQP